jgi:hypothetical protein
MPGMTTAYIEKFGLHEQELVPIGIESPERRHEVV